MNTRVVIGLLLGAANAVLIGIAWKNFAATQATAAALERANATTARLKAEVGSFERRRLIAEQGAASLKTAASAAKETPSSVTAPVVTSPPPARRSNSIEDLIRDDPEGQVLYLAMQRARLGRTYGPLFRQLGLSAEQSAAFQENILHRDECRMDLKHVATGEFDRETLARMQREVVTDYHAAQRALLGDGGLVQLQSYERTSWIRGIVSSVAGTAAVEQVPFDPLQADKLVQAIADASESYRKGGYAQTNDVDWEVVDRKAREILSEAQFAVFRTRDPGPSTPGIVQSRMYALVEQALKEERRALQAANRTPSR